MSSSRARRYRAVGHRAVRGWLAPEVLDVVAVLDEAQRSAAVSGAVAEIGVHHGCFFIGLRLLQRPGERSVAIDVFDEQDLNVDRSGRGDLAIFRRNLDRWASHDDVVIHQGDSTRLDPATVEELAGGPVRLFSVDGGHTEAIVLSDLRLATASLAEGGVVVADDVFNPMWPGVAVGTLRYLEGDGALVPFLIGFNKVFLTTPGSAARYQDAVTARFGGRVLVARSTSVYAGHDVVLLDRVARRPAELLYRSTTARTVYRRIRAALPSPGTSKYRSR